MAAAEAAHELARDLEPVSVFISRKTQRLYVRQAFRPILESPVTIQDTDRPIGTHVFTAVARNSGDGEMRWSVVSLRAGHSDDLAERPSPGRGSRGREAEAMAANPDGASEALERIAIPQDIQDRIAAMVSPRSSLIVSDEALSSESGNGTEFASRKEASNSGAAARRTSGTSVRAIVCLDGFRLSAPGLSHGERQLRI